MLLLKIFASVFCKLMAVKNCICLFVRVESFVTGKHKCTSVYYSNFALVGMCGVAAALALPLVQRVCYACHWSVMWWATRLFCNSSCHLWVVVKGLCSAVCYLTKHTPKTLSFTFRVNAVLSARICSLQTNPLPLCLPPFSTQTKTITVRHHTH